VSCFIPGTIEINNQQIRGLVMEISRRGNVSGYLQTLI
jgi:hypothetical protein